MMSDFVRDFKKFTANAVIKDIQNMPESRRDWMLFRFEFAGKYDNRITKYRFWQDKSHPIELTSTEMIDQRINYTHENPVRTGSPRVVKEAMACGCPIVCTDLPGTRFLDGKNKVLKLFPAKSTVHLKEMIGCIIYKEKIDNQAIRDYALKHFSPDVIADLSLKLYDEL